MRWLLLVSLFFSLIASGQTNLIENLRKKFYAAATEEQKLEALIQLFDEYQSINRDTLDEYGPLVKAFGDKSENPRLKSLSALAYANWYFRWGWSDSALVFIEPELEKNPVSNPKKRDIYFKLARAKALYLGSKSRYAEALDVLYKVLPEAEKYRDTLNIGLTCNTIGSVALGRSQPEEALKWIRRAILLTENKPSFYQVLAPAYLNAGNAFAILGKNDSAVYFVQKALPLCQAIENLNYTATGLRILSSVYTQSGRFKEAEAAMLDMMAVRRKTSPANILVEDNLQLARFYANTGQLEKAIQWCLQNLKKGDLTDTKGDSNAIYTNDPKIRLSFLETLAGFYKQAGRADEYINALEELVAAKDSFYEANSAEIIGELQTRYDLKNKENIILKQKYDLQQKNFLFYATVGLVVIFTIAAFVKIRKYLRGLQKRMDNMMQEEKRLSMEAVKKAEEKERVRIAADLHDNLGAYAASISANISYLHLPDANADTQNTLLELNKNAAAIVSQLNDTIWVLKKDALPLTAISDRIKKFISQVIGSYPEINADVHEEIILDVSLTSSQAFHLYRLLQEAINNALKHSRGYNIAIYFKADGKNWQVEITDDGVGMPEVEKKDSGFGLQHMRERCAEVGWTIRWNQPETGGTTVIISSTTN
jgi:signal transduction histidine kinase